MVVSIEVRMWRLRVMYWVVSIVMLEVLCVVACSPRVLERRGIQFASGSSSFRCVGRVSGSVVRLV